MMQSYKKIVISILWLLISSQVWAQYTVPKKPSFIPPVIDEVNLLTQRQYNSLTEKLKRYSDTTSTEIVVVIIPTTKGESIGILAPRWAHEWGIGQAKEDNGVFILLAKDDRNIWIAPGYGVEYKLTAGTLGELTRSVIIPEFKRGDYYAGLDKGTDGIIKILNGTFTKEPTKKASKKKNYFMFFLLLILIIIIINGRGGRGGRRRRSVAGTLLDVIILSNAGRGSFGGGSFGGGSSGGFGGFGGGGGFSGGGAGGSW